MRSLELDQSRCEPERSQSFRNGQLHQPINRRDGSVACPDQAEGRRLHLLRGLENLRSLRRRPHAVNMPRQQRNPKLLLEF
jgi:hypothetical protein